MIFFVRTIHILIGLFFIFCLAFVYYTILTHKIGFWTYAALAAIIVEGLLLWLNNGKCPLTILQNKLGDNKGFFDLFLPAGALPFVIPLFAVLTIIAIILIFIR